MNTVLIDSLKSNFHTIVNKCGINIKLIYVINICIAYYMLDES